jgi:hypothetical protein
MENPPSPELFLVLSPELLSLQEYFGTARTLLLI